MAAESAPVPAASDPADPTAPVPAAPRRRAPSTAVVALGVAVVAVATRLLLMSRNGFTSVGAYDDGVYYTAAANLLHGVLPYRDVLLLHPPGLTLLLTPFAWLGERTSDVVGLVGARLAVVALGGLTAALIVRYLARWGRGPALTGGLVYALLFPAAYSERTILLEPVGNAAMLLALVLLPRRGAGRSWAPIVAGLVLGLATATKLWYALPTLVLTLCQTWRDAVRLVAAAALAFLAVVLPFAVRAPGPFVRFVVLDQLGRPHAGTAVTRLGRLVEYLLARTEAPTLLLAVALAVLGLATVLALTLPGARCVTAMLVANTLLLVASPLLLLHYVAYVTALGSVVLGAAVARLGRLPGVGRIAGPVAAVVLVVAVAGTSLPRIVRGVDEPFPVARIRALTDPVKGCVMAQDPTYLAMIDRLSSDLAAGCRVHPDTTGWIYDPVVMREARARIPFRDDNPRWQALELRYLRSGEAAIVGGRGISLTPATREALAQGGVIGRVPPFTVYRTPALGPMPLPR